MDPDGSGWPLRSGSLTYFHDDGQQTASCTWCFQMGSRRNPGSNWDRYSILICCYKHWQICWKPVCFCFCAGYLRLAIKLFIFSLAEHVDVTMALGWYNNPHWQLQRPPLAEMFSTSDLNGLDLKNPMTSPLRPRGRCEWWWICWCLQDIG